MGTTFYYINDTTGGISLDLNNSDIEISNYIGENKVLELTGTVKIIDGLYKIENITKHRLVDDDIKPKFNININDINVGKDLKKYVGSLVSLENLLLINNEYIYGSGTTLTFLKEDNEKIEIIINDFIKYNELAMDILPYLEKGENLCLNNLMVTVSFGKYILIPSFYLEVKKVPHTDSQLASIDLSNISIPSSITNSNFKLVLPKQGENGSTITYKTESNLINLNTGEVTFTKKEEIIKLKVVSTYGTKTLSKEFEIVILSKKDIIKNDVNITLNEVKKSVLSRYKEDTKLDLKDSINGVKLTYISDNNDIFNPQTKIIKPDPTREILITLTVYAVKETIKEIINIKFYVGDYELIKIKDINIINDPDKEFRLNGYLVAKPYENNYIIEDDTGSIMFNGNYDDYTSYLDKEVIINAKFNQQELEIITINFSDTKISEPLTKNIDDLSLDEALNNYTNKLVSLTNLKVLDIYEDSYGARVILLKTNNEEEISVYIDFSAMENIEDSTRRFINNDLTKDMIIDIDNALLQPFDGESYLYPGVNFNILKK